MAARAAAKTVILDEAKVPLRISTLACLCIAAVLPVPLMTASGLSLPLPTFVEKMAFALAPGSEPEAPALPTPTQPSLVIAHTDTERAASARLAARPTSPPRSQAPPPVSSWTRPVRAEREPAAATLDNTRARPAAVPHHTR
jgi:hypothetical protein